jgi:hypothetical protein
MNIYKITHRAECPNGGLTDIYQIILRSPYSIQVEHIIKTLQEMPAAIYQEDLATLLRSQLGVEVTVIGNHHGVEITSIRN